MIYRKKGKLAKSEQNEFVLLDDNQKGYKADNVVLTVWSMCDGKRTKEQMVEELSKKTNTEKTEIDKAVTEILEKLEQISLVEKV